ncbi:hypothetical protein SPO1099 [Ruegeria pomeroyi DSS-3]|uniref:Uncharacterized protein n=1 Tax=Ruegeria pomeroyi (strain ATCC 700808 / DSM 15171 / DSS-3) TaxID=246200 RepID=Q5LUF5_RUEPO|nr:hypothetical protein SPO1099 [Ruegeria pomeroyi DSS-3]
MMSLTSNRPSFYPRPARVDRRISPKLRGPPLRLSRRVRAA